MTPQDQEFINKPEINQYGDCQRACIASLLDLPIADVPHFLQVANGSPDGFWDGIQSFLGERGLALVQVTSLAAWCRWGEGKNLHHIIGGPSPRGNGLYHSVVGCNGEIVFDPHASRAGLAGDPMKWSHSFLVKL